MSNDGFFDKQQQVFYFDALAKANSRDKFAKIVHYTDTSVLDSLLSKGVMWATNIFYLNDNVEYTAGIEVLKKSFKKSKKILDIVNQLDADNGYNWPGVYTMSFSFESDELQQWITYAKDSGVSIEFDSETMLAPRRMCIYQRYADRTTSNIGKSKYYGSYDRRLYKITYINQSDPVSDKVARRIKAAITKVAQYKGLDCNTECSECCKYDSCWLDDRRYAEYTKGLLRLITTYFKSTTFHGEDEIRASFLPAEDGINESRRRSEISHVRKTNGMLRPYMKIIFGNTPYDGDMKPKPAVPIKAITVGPSGIQDKLYASVVHRVKYGDTRAVWFDDEPYLKKRIEEYLNGVISPKGGKIVQRTKI